MTAPLWMPELTEAPMVDYRRSGMVSGINLAEIVLAIALFEATVDWIVAVTPTILFKASCRCFGQPEGRRPSLQRGTLLMKKTIISLAALMALPFAFSASAQDVGKLMEAVDQDKAMESVDQEKMTEAVTGDDIDYKKAYDSVDKEKASESVDLDKVKEAMTSE